MAVLLAAPVLLAGCSDDTSIPPPAAPSATSSDQVGAAQQALAGLERALAVGDAEAARALGLATATDLLAEAARNVTRLRLDEVSLRYVQEVAGTTIAGTSDFGPGSWQATVAVGYRLRGWDAETTRLETTFTFAPGPEGLLVAGVGSAQGRTPLWLTGPVTPVVSGRTLVLARGTDGTRESRFARRAVQDVGRVIPSWKGRLVVESPATEDEFDRALGATREQYASIAAVTAAVDGSTVGGAPLHVFLNPALFAGLGPRAAQVVLSHESTHVATRAPYTTGMPTWLIEGFADYVALAHSGIGVQTAAAQILKRIRTEGVPDDLPSDEDLVPTADGLGAAYEEAWLVNRFLAARYGETKLIRFYNAVDRGATVDETFGSVLGTTRAAFVTAWRADLRSLARLAG